MEFWYGLCNIVWANSCCMGAFKHLVQSLQRARAALLSLPP